MGEKPLNIKYSKIPLESMIWFEEQKNLAFLIKIKTFRNPLKLTDF